MIISDALGFRRPRPTRSASDARPASHAHMEEYVAGIVAFLHTQPHGTSALSFNVALTRACSLLIIVGNPHVLAPDPHWGRLLRTCIEKSAYTGVPPPPPPGDDDDPTGGGDGDELLADRLAEMMLGADDGEEDFVEVSHQQLQEGNEMPNWGQS